MTSFLEVKIDSVQFWQDKYVLVGTFCTCLLFDLFEQTISVNSVFTMLLAVFDRSI